MLTKENNEIINLVLNKVFSFVQTNAIVQQDLSLYAQTLDQSLSDAQTKSLLVNYVFDRMLGDTGKKVFDIYLEETPDLTNTEKDIIAGLSDSISSVFEVKKLTKEGFGLYNLINENYYNVQTLIKTVNFRGIIPEQYLICRIFPFNNAYYLAGIDSILNSNAKIDAYRYAVMKQLENPELLYRDNENKLAEIEKTVHDLGIKFKEYFQQDEIITTSQYVDELLSGFNDYIETNEKPDGNIDELVKLPEKYAYFDVPEVTSGVSDPIQAAVKGFSSHEKIYDVGIVFDTDSGLLVLPFYGTFKQIFSSGDYKSIEGYKDCIMRYLESDRVPPSPILRVYNENKNTFMNVIADSLEIENQSDPQEFLHKYKGKYFAQKTFSALTVLYLSTAFNELMEIARGNSVQESSAQQVVAKAGRNEPCPCGSGKKFKKCCLK